LRINNLVVTFRPMSLTESSETAPVPRKYERKANVTGVVRTAIEAMVWNGLPRSKAAEKAGISEHGLYKALRKPPVKAFYLSELEVLRSSERARNIHTLIEVRDQKKNQMARVQAVSKLEQLADEQHAGANKQSLPGLVVQINVGSDTRLTQPTATIIDNADGSR
jgi:hypothetical protein